jgi:DNA-binding MarR family transcriptional regulator
MNHAGKATAAAPPPAIRNKLDIHYGLLPGLVGYQLRMAQIALFRDFAQGPGEHDVTPGLFGVLVIIEANPDLKQSDLARAAHLDRSTVVTVIDNLQRRGLVERRAALNDRRSNAIRLTPDGSALLRKLKRQVNQHEKRLLRNFNTAERELFLGLLQKVFPEHR